MAEPTSEATQQSISTAVRPPETLYVDLDGTLVATDLLWEATLSVVKADPLALLRFPGWLLKGRAAFKCQVAARANLDLEHAPVREEVVELIRRRRAEGARVVLATASHHRIAAGLNEHLRLFDDILATDERRNLKGEVKLDAIQEDCARHGESAFAYVGDSRADLRVWRQAARAYVVEPSAGLLTAVKRTAAATEVLVPRRPRWRAWAKVLRPHQWVKNLLLLIPLILAHHVRDALGWWHVGLAFLSFCLAASGVYLANDLLDLEADRRHPTKRRRAFAAGRLPIGQGVAASLGLFAAGFLAAAFVSPRMMAALAVYLAANLLYTFWLKRKLVIDVVLLAGMYTLRIIAGGVAAEVEVSEWLLAFSTFFFGSLAFLKRYIELLHLERSGGTRARGRGYQIIDLESVFSFGSACGYMAVMVTALYINSDKVKKLYARPEWLWLMCPLLIYWISRVWMWGRRGSLHEDPVAFALKDRTSWLVLLAALLIVWAAT